MPGLREWLAASPSGGVAFDLDWDLVAKWLRDRYLVGSREEADRQTRFRRRHDMYMCGGWRDMETFIDKVFRDPEVRLKRQDWVERANFNNPLRRVVNEKSTVYLEPARRTVANAQANQRYQELQRACRQHEASRRMNRWLNLHNNLALGFRVRSETDGTRRPVIDIVTPGHFFAVSDPLDPTKLVALIFVLNLAGPLIGKDAPAFLAWTDYEYFYMTREGFVIKESVTEHGYARMPWLLLSNEPPTGKLLDETNGEDLVAATMASWFQHILLLKEAKSATKQPVLQGDLTASARAQASDSEIPIEVPDGTAISAIDLSMNLSMFMDSARYIYETAAANHGVAPALLMHQGVQSAEARELMRLPLRELRLDQQVYLREVEREFALLQAMVLEREAPEMAFNPDGWRIDFADPQTPLSQKQQLEVFEHSKRLGLTDTVEEIQRRNPDLNERDAVSELERHVAIETMRNIIMRPLQAVSGSMASESVADEATPQAPQEAATA